MSENLFILLVSTPLKESGKDDGIGQGNTGEDRVHKNTLKSAILSIKGLPGFTPLYSMACIYSFINRSYYGSNVIILFKQFPGFQSVQIDSEKPGLASVEFEVLLRQQLHCQGCKVFV